MSSKKGKQKKNKIKTPSGKEGSASAGDAKKSLGEKVTHLFDKMSSLFFGGDLAFVSTRFNQSKYIPKRKKIIKSNSLSRAFFTEAKSAFRYCLLEPEMILFSTLNALSLFFLFCIFIYGFLATMPEVFDGLSLFALIVFWPVWLWLCLWTLSNLTGFFTGAMGISVLKRMNGEKSTVPGCLAESLSRRKNIQRYEWNTLTRTIALAANRIPGEHETEAESKKYKREFYGWRYGKFAILPHILLGKPLVEAGQASVEMVKRNFKEVCLFRTAYSRVRLLLWFFTWMAMSYYFAFGPGRSPDEDNVIAMILAQGILSVIPFMLLTRIFLYPVLVISSCCRTMEDLEKQKNE